MNNVKHQRILPDHDFLLAHFKEFIRQKDESFESAIAASAGYNDVYKAGEHIVRDMMNAFFDYNLKMEGKCNAAGFDLRDEDNNVIVQVTHNQNKSEKVENCLRTTSKRVTDENLGKPKLYIVFLDRKSLASLKANTKTKIDGNRYGFSVAVEFDPENNILNLDSFVGMLQDSQNADGTMLSVESRWKIVAFLQAMGRNIDIPGDREGRRFDWNLDADDNVFTLSDLKEMMETFRREEFISDWDFIEAIFPDRIRTDLQIESGIEIRKLMEGLIRNECRQKVYTTLKHRRDVINGSNGLIRKCRQQIPGRIQFKNYYKIIFQHLGEDGKYLHECARWGEWLTYPYLGIAMLAVFAVIGPDYFEELIENATKNRLTQITSLFSPVEE